MSRLLPYPLLTLSLLVMWILLNGFTPGHVLLGGVIAIFASWAMSLLTPAKPRLRRWDLIPKLVGTVLIDVFRSNVAVARLIFQARAPASGFVAVPLDLRDRTALAVLACIITSTPGTAWVEYDSVSSVLLIHVLDLADEAAWIDTVKSRYESLLMEIFE
ncbi:Na+/H+ antiporter subunit E [Inquilinus sp. CAU 1745]|uniref:Na+/H+ antiporter subunit E n=1 Tax=Inquilinus sp. CAU 1745 TaxID=3140369 RepID=UPI00325C2BE9